MSKVIVGGMHLSSKAALVAVSLALVPVQPWQYPAAPTGKDVDTYHGTEVPDPYRWLETDTPERSAFIRAQQSLLDGYLNEGHTRAEFSRQIRPLVDHAAISTPLKGGHFYFYVKGSGVNLRANRTLVMRPVAGGDERVLVGPNAGGPSVGVFAPSPDGTMVAFAEPRTASAPAAWRLLRTSDAALLPDRIDIAHPLTSFVKWTPDSRGFFYVTVEPRDTGTTAGPKTQRTSGVTTPSC